MLKIRYIFKKKWHSGVFVLKALNFLFAISNETAIGASERILQGLRQKLMNEINESQSIRVGRFDFIHTKSEVTEKIKGNDYDVILCSEELNEGELIGVGSIRSLSELNPGVKFILIMGKTQKGCPKLVRMINLLNYTNGLFMEDLSGSNIVSLLEEGRSVEDAIAYYGVSENEEIKGYSGSSTKKEEENENASADASEEVPAQEGKGEDITENLDDIAGSFDDMFKEEVKDMKEEDIKEEPQPFAGFDFGEEKEDSVKEPDGVSSNNKEEISGRADGAMAQGFDFSVNSMNAAEEDAVSQVRESAGEDASFLWEAGNGSECLNSPHAEDVSKEIVEIMEESEETTVEVLEPVIIEEVSESGSGNAEREFGFAMQMPARVSSFNKAETVTAKGYIKSVVDSDSILVELEETEDFIGIDMEEYKFLLRIKSGQKGVMQGGRYRSANITMEAYVEYVVKERTLMLEVENFDCLYNRDFLVNKNCSVLMSKL